MKEFIFFFRGDYRNISEAPPEEMKERMTKWMEWINSISGQNKLAVGGNHLSQHGKLLKSKNKVTDGPYSKNNESILGYIIVDAKSYDDAIELAKACPILEGTGTSVEIREISTI